MSLIKPWPNAFQRENWLFDRRKRWRKVGRLGWDQLFNLEQPPNDLWVNGYSTYYGSNNYVPADRTSGLKDSLKLIRVNRLKLLVHVPGRNFGNLSRVVDAHFWYAGSRYALRVTDLLYKNAYCAKPDGMYELGESFLTVSLAELHGDSHYKLVAAIIERVPTVTGGR